MAPSVSEGVDSLCCLLLSAEECLFVWDTWRVLRMFKVIRRKRFL